MSRADWQITQAAKIICDFMGWTEDGPAWIDAHKLAAALSAQASPAQRSAPQNPSVDAGLLEALNDALAVLKSVMPAKLIGESYETPVPDNEILREFLFTWGKLRAARSAIARAESSQGVGVGLLELITEIVHREENEVGMSDVGWDDWMCELRSRFPQSSQGVDASLVGGVS